MAAVSGLSRPTADSIKQDAWAVVTVGLVLVPQAIAYASLAGMPPQTGLYAALLPAVIGTSCGGRRRCWRLARWR